MNKGSPKRVEDLPHIQDDIEERARSDGLYAIAYALLRLEEPASRLATALSDLGLAGAMGPRGGSMGAIELLSSEVKRIADAYEVVAAEARARLRREEEADAE